MKYFIVTDLHGSAFWAEQAVQKFKNTHSDVMVVLGDVYNHGPRNPFPQQYAPMNVAEILGSVADKLIVVKGNCDSEVDEMISSFPIVQNNIVCAFGRQLFFTHGHVFNKNNLPKLHNGDVMFYGHFHTNEIVQVGQITCVNVSSCALPKDVAAYCVVDESGVALYTFDDTPILTFAF